MKTGTPFAFSHLVHDHGSLNGATYTLLCLSTLDKPSRKHPHRYPDVCFSEDFKSTQVYNYPPQWVIGQY